MTKSCKSLVVQSNTLINASYNLTLAEKRIMLLMIVQIEREDADFKSYRINIKDFIDELGTSAKNEYERARELTKSMMKRVLEVKEGNDVLQVSLLSSARYHKGKGFVDLRFDPSLKPYLLQLKERFTSYSLQNILHLRSVHSVRVYELLKQFELIGERTIEVDELKNALGVSEKYKLYGHLKDRVLIPSQKELSEHTDITFDFEEIKIGRRIGKIKFIIQRKPKQLEEVSSDKSELLQELIDLGVEKPQALKYVQSKDMNFLKESVDYVKKKYKVGKVHNLGGYVKSVIERDASIVTPYEKRLKDELEEKIIRETEQKAQIEVLKDEFQKERNIKLDNLVSQMTQEKRKAFFNSRNSIEKMMIFDGQGKLKENMANGLLRNHLAKENGLEFTDEAFRNWVRVEKSIELTQEVRNGDFEWVIVGEQLKLV